MNKKIRILQCFVGNSKGGRTEYIRNNWKFIDKDRFQFDFATLSPSLDFAEELEKDGSRIYYISCFAEDNKEQFIKEIDAALQNDYDIVHIHSSLWRSTIIEERARLAGIKKIILHAHNFGIGTIANGNIKEIEEQHNKIKQTIKPENADYYLACSREASDWMYNEHIPNEKKKVLRNGIDLLRYRYREDVREDIRKQMGLENKYVIGHIGRFVFQKNHSFLIEVFERVVKQIPEATLMLIGFGELQDEIREKVHILGLDDSVMFLNSRSDVEKLMQAMDIFTLPSRFDGFPLSLLEAQAAGLPCIAGNVPEQAVLNERSYIVKLEIDKWVDAILREYRCGGRCEVSQRLYEGHDIRSQVKELEKIYEEGLR